MKWSFLLMWSFLSKAIDFMDLSLPAWDVVICNPSRTRSVSKKGINSRFKDSQLRKHGAPCASTRMCSNFMFVSLCHLKGMPRELNTRSVKTTKNYHRKKMYDYVWLIPVSYYRCAIKKDTIPPSSPKQTGASYEVRAVRTTQTCRVWGLGVQGLGPWGGLKF